MSAPAWELVEAGELVEGALFAWSQDGGLWKVMTLESGPHAVTGVERVAMLCLPFLWEPTPQRLWVCPADTMVWRVTP